MKFLKELSPKYIRIIFLGFIIILSAFVFEEVADDVFSDPKEGDPETLIFDKSILNYFKSVRTAGLNQSMIDFTALGSVSVIVLLTTVLVIIFVAHRDWRGLSYICIMGAGMATIPVWLKDYYMRARPDVLEHLAVVKSASFPSGHSFGATAAYMSLAFLLSRELKKLHLEVLYYVVAMMVIGLVGISRMYLGVHYPTDIVAGVSVGFIWFSVVSIPFIYFSKSQVNVE